MLNPSNPTIPTLLITGPVGVGKTTVATEVSELLDRAGGLHAIVDMDALRGINTSTSADRFHTALGLRNLTAVWQNYQAAGARRLVLADVLEANEDLAMYEIAVPGAAIQVVRLRAAVSMIWRRLEGRDRGASLEWSRNRAVELTELMDSQHIGHHVIDTDSKSIEEVGREVLDRCKW